MSYNNKEYSVVATKDKYGDDCQFILRESTLPTGLIKIEELAKLEFGDVNEHFFPEGLIEPTPEEIERFGGKKPTRVEPLSSEIPHFTSPTDISGIKQRITSFVLEGVQSGRQPTFSWNDLATEPEVDAFQEAAIDAQNIHNSLGQDPQKDESYGLYL